MARSASTACPAAFIAILGLTLSACGPAQSDTGLRSPPVQDRAWVELTATGAQARLVTAAAACPSALLDGKPAPMVQRAAPSADFPGLVCELDLPAGVTAASVNGLALALPKARPQRLVIFGDTGCRLKGARAQNCNDPDAWTFPTVTKLAAGHHPDLVIHVGDYYYREVPCPDGDAGCANSPWGDKWATWDAEFFQPASPLFAAAPWVMVRGNHEDCDRGGPGWFRLLDAAPAPLACPAEAAPMAIDIGGVTLGVLDSADTVDNSAPADAVNRFGAQFDALHAKAPLWILTHRPVWGLVMAKIGPLGAEVPINATEQAALRGRDLSAVQMVVSGHIHYFASLAFQGDRPAQLIVGTGGDDKDPEAPGDVVNMDGMNATRYSFSRYGFLVLDRAGKDWTGAFFDIHDHVIARCRLHGRDLECAAASS